MAEAQEPKKSRKIGDVFSDYKTNSNIADAVITKMNLIKKINTLNNCKLYHLFNILCHLFYML